ncbi:unnamed protein product [Echinostoma caproni]|uniref:Ig-like domain-containing protein n=1 Tax=Echinostoma caproni TaxID=27848 RepID=A0A183A2C9_9TREM|nr:unnamed protein product [Echinostoma caproni]
MVLSQITVYILFFLHPTPSGNQILEIVESHDYHEGTYTCVLSNKHGQYMSADATLRLIEPIKPRITDAPPADNNRVVEHSDMELRCSAYGRPRPRISWLWQEETLPLHLVTGGRYIVRSVASGVQTTVPADATIYSTNSMILASAEAAETESILLIRNVTQADAHGRYICYASNRIGSARVSTVIRVIPRHEAMAAEKGTEMSHSVEAESSSGHTPGPRYTSPEELQALQGDELVRHVIDKARVRIEAAIRKTAERLRDPTRRRSSSDVASLFRQPSQAALELAKAAEVYEAAIDEVTSILRQRNEQSLKIEGSPDPGDTMPDIDRDPQSREALGVKLSADQLAIISQLSGCQQSSNIDPCSRQLCFHLRYRSIDGSCNNFNHPRWGAALTPFRRLLAPQYENGINTPIGWSPTRLYFGYPKPSARLVSRELLGNATLQVKIANR